MINRFKSGNEGIIMVKQMLVLAVVAISYSNICAAAHGPSVSKVVSAENELRIANALEIDQLLKKYQKPIVIQPIADMDIDKVELTEKVLKHVFGMEVKKGADNFKELSLKGFHHDANLELEHQEQSFYRCEKSNSVISAGFIAHKKTHLPVFKTLFSSLLSREQVIDAWIESLQNIQQCEKQSKYKRLLTGQATIPNWKNKKIDVVIKTVVDKKTGQVITFFPVLQKDDIKQEKKKLDLLWSKHFLNVEKKPERTSITKEEVEQLLKLFPNGIQVNWVIIGDNLLFRSKKQFSEEALAKLNPRIDDKMPKYMHNINITAQSLANVFSPENDKNFPIYLSRIDILEKLQEALENINIYGRGDAHNITVCNDDIEREITVYDNGGFHRDSFISKKNAEHSINLLTLESCSNGKNEKDIWKFYIIINEDTGDLENFYPLFY